MQWGLNCRDAGAILSRVLDGDGNLRDKLLLGLHVLTCREEPCRNYRRQLLKIRRILREGIPLPPCTGLDPAARDRIAAVLGKQTDPQN